MCSNAWCQEAPTQREVKNLTVHGAQRLAALAKVGALTRTTMLVEVGDMRVMQAPVDVQMRRGTVRDAVQQIMGSYTRYKLRNREGLLILSTATFKDRLLTLRLQEFNSRSGKVSSFDPLLSESLREASGCKPRGMAWAGAEMSVDVPTIDIADASFEQIVAAFAKAPQQTMWIFQTQRRPARCINNPGASWEIGAYDFGSEGSGCQTPFVSSAGPQFLGLWPLPHAFLDDCTSVQLQSGTAF